MLKERASAWFYRCHSCTLPLRNACPFLPLRLISCAVWCTVLLFAVIPAILPWTSAGVIGVVNALCILCCPLPFICLFFTDSCCAFGDASPVLPAGALSTGRCSHSVPAPGRWHGTPRTTMVCFKRRTFISDVLPDVRVAIPNETRVAFTG
jgi:hypothetical protein